MSKTLNALPERQPICLNFCGLLLEGRTGLQSHLVNRPCDYSISVTPLCGFFFLAVERPRSVMIRGQRRDAKNWQHAWKSSPTPPASKKHCSGFSAFAIAFYVI